MDQADALRRELCAAQRILRRGHPDPGIAHRNVSALSQINPTWKKFNRKIYVKQIESLKNDCYQFFEWDTKQKTLQTDVRREYAGEEGAQAFVVDGPNARWGGKRFAKQSGVQCMTLRNFWKVGIVWK